MKNSESISASLWDESSVRALIARFAEAANLADYDRFRTCWAEDGDWMIPAPFAAHARGLDEIVAMLRTLREGKEFFVQMATPGVIDLDGDTATVRCVIHEAARGTGGVYYRNYGFFNDRLCRSGDGWVFTHRAYQYLWLDTSPFSGDVFPLPAERPF